MFATDFYNTIKLCDRLTDTKTHLPAASNLSSCESSIINLDTRYASTEVPSITNTRSDTDRIICSQSYPSNSSSRNKSVLHKQFRNARAIVVCCGNELPFVVSYSATGERWRESTSSSLCVADKQCSGANHPEVYSPSIRHIVKDGT